MFSATGVADRVPQIAAAMVLAMVGLAVLWLLNFPLKPDPDWNDVLFESLHLAAGLVLLVVLARPVYGVAFLGWGLYCIALTGDLLDEFTRESDLYDTTLPALFEIGGLAICAVALVGTHRRLRQQLEDLREAKAAVDRAAYRDALTGLPNRHRLLGELEARTAGLPEAPFALLYVDLDDFKTVNDAHGHAEGDRVLLAVAERFQSQLLPGEMLGRWGGDEFLCVVGPEDPEARAAALVRVLEQPVPGSCRAHALGTSIGLVRLPQDTAIAQEALKLADAAMYAAKADRNRSVVAAAEGLVAS